MKDKIIKAIEWVEDVEFYSGKDAVIREINKKFADYESVCDLLGKVYYEPSEESEVDNSLPIAKLDLSPRAQNILTRAKIDTISKLKNASLNDLMKVRNMGNKTLLEIIEKVVAHG